ncbi:MAG: hypothetical protein PVG39_30785 [Desulfobacteraceae bacterium]|jgi:hypothetical protein
MNKRCYDKGHRFFKTDIDEHVSRVGRSFILERHICYECLDCGKIMAEVKPVGIIRSHNLSKGQLQELSLGFSPKVTSQNCFVLEKGIRKLLRKAACLL